MQKLIIYIVLLVPLMGLSQNTIKVRKETDTLQNIALVKYCGSSGEKTLQFIPKCRSLRVDTNFFEIISYNFTAVTDGKIWSYNIQNNKLSKEIIETHFNTKKGIVFFDNIKLRYKKTNQLIDWKALTIKWYTR